MEDDNWQLRRSLVACNKYMLEEKIDCDVKFVVGQDSSKETIEAHHYMLICRSPVFRAMLVGDLSEPKGTPIRVPDVEPEAFRQMLRYVYCDEALLSPDIVLPTLYASKKYLLPSLTDKCTAFLEDSLQPDNVCLIYEQSILYDEIALVEKCNKYISSRTDEVLHSPSFLEITRHTLCSILKFTSLSVSELDIFKGCLSWATEECKRRSKDASPDNQREVLGEALYLIHFPCIPLKDFSNIVAKARILTAEEKCAVYEFLTSDDVDAARNLDFEMKFPIRQRQKPHPSVVRRFTNFSKSNVYSGDCSIMKIQSDLPVVINGFGVSGSVGYDPLAEVQITIKQERAILCNKSIPITDDMSGDIIQVILPDEGPVVLKPNVWYTVIVTFHFYGEHDQGSCRRGKGGQRSFRCDGVTFEFDRPDTAGFVPEILFRSIQEF